MLDIRCNLLLILQNIIVLIQVSKRIRNISDFGRNFRTKVFDNPLNKRLEDLRLAIIFTGQIALDGSSLIKLLIDLLVLVVIHLLISLQNYMMVEMVFFLF